MTAVVELRTERVVLRDWRDEDLLPFAALNADPRVMAHFPSVLTREQSDAMACGAFVGFVGLSRPRFEAPFTPCVELGCRLAHHAQGKGLATEAARAALRFARSGTSRAGTAAHRQWTLSLPFSVRFNVVKKPKLLKRLAAASDSVCI